LILKKRNSISYFKVFFGLIFLVSISSCVEKDKPQKIAAVKDRAALPQLHAVDVTTVISDSGVTKYRITTPVWDMYDRANQPYWEFKQGLQLERFDKNLRVETNIHCKYARYNENQQLWELRGRVKMNNIRGQLFETSLLYWSQRDSKFYSDSAITITDATRIIKGVGFDSNQDMTNYHIRKINGVFPVQND